MKIGVIGLGYWGPNLVRNFIAQPEVSKVIGCDLQESRRSFIQKRFPSAELLADYNDLLKSDVDAIVIATPVDTHFKFAKAALEAGKHIWVEKPFTATSDQAKELIDISEKKNLKIFVDHTFIYTGSIAKIKELIRENELGEIKYFDSVRINLGLFQHDVNVIWDLAPHDLSIMQYLMEDSKVAGVAANGIANYSDHENVIYLYIFKIMLSHIFMLIGPHRLRLDG